MQPIQADDIIPRPAQLVQRIPRPLGKDRHRHALDLELLEPARQLGRDVPQVRQGEVGETRGRELAGPAVEDHDGLRARDDLAREVLDAEVGDDGEQGPRLGRVPVQPGLGGAEDLGPPALDHVAEQGPGRAAEADEWDPAPELLARQRDGAVDVVELRGHVDFLRDEFGVLWVRGRGERVRERWALFREHLHRHAHGLRTGGVCVR